VQWLTDIMARGMEVFFEATGNYGFAIILLTIVIRTVLLPLTVAQTRSTQKMQELNPKIEELKKKYKNEPEKLNQKTMELWRSQKVNPLSGCLLLLVQFPFLIAFFRLLNDYAYQGSASFLWISHLGKPDALFILPVLAAATTFWQTKVATPVADSSQNTMLYAMPLLIGWISTRFAAGLALYWVVSNLYGIAQHYITPRPRVGKGEATG